MYVRGEVSPLISSALSIANMSLNPVPTCSSGRGVGLSTASLDYLPVVMPPPHPTSYFTVEGFFSLISYVPLGWY